MAKSLKTLKHPTLDDVTVQVPSGDVDSWVAQGWLPSEPSTNEPSATPKATPATA